MNPDGRGVCGSGDPGNCCADVKYGFIISQKGAGGNLFGIIKAERTNLSAL